MYISPVFSDCRVNRQHICKGIRPHNELPVCDIKPADEQVPAMEI